jgi:hypothetical protein
LLFCFYYSRQWRIYGFGLWWRLFIKSHLRALWHVTSQCKVPLAWITSSIMYYYKPLKYKYKEFPTIMVSMKTWSLKKSIS